MKSSVLLAAMLSLFGFSALYSQTGPSPFPTIDADWPGKGPIRTFPYMNDNRKAFWDHRSQDQGAVVLVGDSLVGGVEKWEPLKKGVSQLVDRQPRDWWRHEPRGIVSLSGRCAGPASQGDCDVGRIE